MATGATPRATATRVEATAVARTNIALVKYWGKRAGDGNLPAAGSLSLTLDGLFTRTTVAFDSTLSVDDVWLGSAPADTDTTARVVAFLDLVRTRAGTTHRARVTSMNSFPTGSGLASSASAFAALALAATRAAALTLSARDLSALARRGSGSAARSIFGGLVEMSPDGDDPHATPLLDASAWDLRMVVAVVGGGRPKEVLSRAGMAHTAATSPLHRAWLDTVPADLAAAKDAITRRDLAALGEVAERSALGMHATALAARPGLLYFRGATVDALHAVRALRAGGANAWVTIDAGPHVKVLCAPTDEARVAAVLGSVPDVTEVHRCRPGAGAELE